MKTKVMPVMRPKCEKKGCTKNEYFGKRCFFHQKPMKAKSEFSFRIELL